MIRITRARTQDPTKQSEVIATPIRHSKNLADILQALAERKRGELSQLRPSGQGSTPKN